MPLCTFICSGTTDAIVSLHYFYILKVRLDIVLVQQQIRSHRCFRGCLCLLLGLFCLAFDQSVARLALFNKVSEADFDTSRLHRREFITLSRASAIPLNPPFHASTNDKGSKWISVGDYCHCHQSIAFGCVLCGAAQECSVCVCERV